MHTPITRRPIRRLATSAAVAAALIVGGGIPAFAEDVEPAAPATEAVAEPAPEPLPEVIEPEVAPEPVPAPVEPAPEPEPVAASAVTAGQTDSTPVPAAVGATAAPFSAEEVVVEFRAVSTTGALIRSWQTYPLDGETSWAAPEDIEGWHLANPADAEPIEFVADASAPQVFEFVYATDVVDLSFHFEDGRTFTVPGVRAGEDSWYDIAGQLARASNEDENLVRMGVFRKGANSEGGTLSSYGNATLTESLSVIDDGQAYDVFVELPPWYVTVYLFGIDAGGSHDLGVIEQYVTYGTWWTFEPPEIEGWVIRPDLEGTWCVRGHGSQDDADPANVCPVEGALSRFGTSSFALEYVRPAAAPAPAAVVEFRDAETGEEIAPPQTLTGEPGETITATPPTFKGYIAFADDWDSTEFGPAGSTVRVVFYYHATGEEPSQSAEVVVRWVDEETGLDLIEPDTVWREYAPAPYDLTDQAFEFDDYALSRVEGNLVGELLAGTRTEVTFFYVRVPVEPPVDPVDPPVEPEPEPEPPVIEPEPTEHTVPRPIIEVGEPVVPITSGPLVRTGEDQVEVALPISAAETGTDAGSLALLALLFGASGIALRRIATGRASS
ncbi:MucBP domain-containing protein [Cellulomonas fimi]|uniref:MucBP domain-containing protein n=1 Tax=Cellulomonas fimi TaxID=1708 RepID=UPI00234D2E1D|nr:MucBP domain-containing protein [Cellulomonas fimi]MDC7120275.1 MucBP domain-containing protein [Cellulomonas fimi]